MKEVKEDRRVRKTRKLYENALIELLKTKDINKITVTDLSEMADLNRGTFYIHYDDIYDLLKSIEDDIISELNHIVEAQPFQNIKPLFEESFTVMVAALEYIEANQKICKVLLNKQGSVLFLSRVKKIFSEKLLQNLMIGSTSDKKYNNILVSFYMTGFIGAIQEWLKGDSNISAFELATVIKAVLTLGTSSLANI